VSPPPAWDIQSKISCARHTVIRFASLIGAGNRPSFTPCHQVLRDTGISGAIGGVALGSPMIWRRRKNLSSVSLSIVGPEASLTMVRCKHVQIQFSITENKLLIQKSNRLFFCPATTGHGYTRDDA
jgi:hypothetical protein